MTSNTSRQPATTAERTLDVAEQLVESRGFNGFSYADVAHELGITKASLHYHFPGKADLGEAVVARHAARFADELGTIDRDVADARAKLDAYVRVYSRVLPEGRMSLCGMLAAEYATLPESIGVVVARFFQDNEAWLTKVVAQGQADGSLWPRAAPTDASRMILSGLEGAMLIGRTHGGVPRFQSIARGLLDALTTSRGPADTN